MPESQQEAFQDDIHAHSNMISSENIPTHLNVEGVRIYLDDEEETSEEEIIIESEEDEAPETNESGDCDNFSN